MDNRIQQSAYLIAHAFGFAPAKVIAVACHFDLFSLLSHKALTGEEIQQQLKLHPRGTYDFLDCLVAMNLLEREGNGTQGIYKNSDTATLFLCKSSSYYVGNVIQQLFDNRLYQSWYNLEEALLTGMPQSELKHIDNSENLFDLLYSETEKLEHFINAMSGISALTAVMLAEKHDFNQYACVCDVGGAGAKMSTTLAQHYTKPKFISFDLPEVAPIAEKEIKKANLEQRVHIINGSFFTDPLPKADALIMSHILHDWDLEKKKMLLQKSYDALPDNGTLIVIETFIDNERRSNLAGLLMSLNMLIELGDAFGYTPQNLEDWCRPIGFKSFETLALTADKYAVFVRK